MSEQGIRTSARLTDLLFDKEGLGLCLVAPDGTILKANNEWLRSTNSSLEQVVGKSIIDLLPDMCEVMLAVQSSASSAGRVVVPLHEVSVLGRPTWWEGLVLAVPLEEGTGLLVTTRDVTSQMSQAPVRETAGAREDTFRLLVEGVKDYAIFMLTPDGTVASWNPGAERLKGYLEREIIGQNFSRFYTEEDIRASKPQRELEMATAKGRYEDEGWRVRKDGSLFWANVVITALRDDAGHLRGFAKVTRDFTERKDAEERRQQQLVDEAALEHERRFRIMADTIPQLASIAEPDGGIHWYNRRWYEYTGTSPEQMAGWGWQSVHDPATLPDVLRRWKESISTGTTFAMEFPLRGADGRFRRFLTRVSPLKDAHGRVLQWFGTNTDVTELIEAREALRETDRRKSEFIALLSHELRNPLAPIKHSLFLLGRVPPGSDAAARATDVIRRQTDHLTKLINDLLDVTRISRGKVELERIPLDLLELFRGACDDHRALFSARHIELRVEATSNPIWVEADGTRLAQVIGNLLQNAAKFSHEGEVVIARASAADGRAEIRLIDEGIGIGADLLPHVFEQFVQADAGLARPTGGLGLGLALVKGLVELHGGSVRAYSQGPGCGAEFVVSLPLVPRPRACAPRPVAPAVRRAIDILVIEDNLDAAESIAAVLRLVGHRVHVATDGRSGLAEARSLKPDVVVCDLGLPDVTGYQVARSLRADTALRSTRLIALSGYAQAEDLERAKDAGFDAHIAKPASVDAILESVSYQALEQGA